MTVKDCGQHNDGKQRRKAILLGLFGFVVLVAFVVFLVWVILRPTKPRFVLQDATIYSFNLSDPNFLTSILQVTVSSRNPNDRIGVYYEKVDIYASYRNQQITLATLLPITYQGHKDIVIWSPFLNGNAVPVAPYLSPALSQDLNTGMVLLDIKVDGWVKWKVGTWISGRYRLHVSCPAYIRVSDRSSGAVIGPAIKYQLVQKCNVDV